MIKKLIFSIIAILLCSCSEIADDTRTRENSKALVGTWEFDYTQLKETGCAEEDMSGDEVFDYRNKKTKVTFNADKTFHKTIWDYDTVGLYCVEADTVRLTDGFEDTTCPGNWIFTITSLKADAMVITWSECDQPVVWRFLRVKK